MGGSTRLAASQPQLHVGVLALQGAFREHVQMLRDLGAKVTEVRLPGDLEGLDGLMIPGGESTTMGLLLEEHQLMEPVRAFIKDHPVFGTCAGLIMMAKETTDGVQPLLQVMDIIVRRNAFGRQPRSFESPVQLSLGAPAPEAATASGAAAPGDAEPAPATQECHGVFIRAPWVEEVGPGVEVIARCGDHVVGVRQGDMMGVAFHPELTDDTRIHEYFLEMIRAARA